jgi:hypothetical protein
MSLETVERAVALVAALVVGITAVVQLKNELSVRGLDAAVTKILLGLMIVGCVLALLASVRVMGG